MKAIKNVQYFYEMVEIDIFMLKSHLTSEYDICLSYDDS